MTQRLKKASTGLHRQSCHETSATILKSLVQVSMAKGWLFPDLLTCSSPLQCRSSVMEAGSSFRQSAIWPFDLLDWLVLRCRGGGFSTLTKKQGYELSNPGFSVQMALFAG